MKRKLIVLLVVLTGLVLLAASALAADDPLKVSMQISASEFTAPEEIDVTIKIANTGDTALPDTVTLYYPDGTQVEEFGAPVLGAGVEKSWSGKWMLTQEQLEEGRITFRARYSIIGDNGEKVTKAKNFAKKITYTGGVTSVEVNRTITPATAGKDQKVTVTYEFVNTGTVEITDVVITENKSVSSKTGTIDRIPVGEKVSYTFTVTMGKKDLTSEAVITYKAGGNDYKATKEKATIKYGEVKLKGTLTADKKGGTAGETVTLTLTLKNSGKEAYNNIVVTDATLGNVFTVETVAAGKTETLEKTITLNENMDLQFNITAQSADGDTVETATDRLSLSVLGADQMIDLRVSAAVENDVVYTFPSIVKFRVYVTNNSNVDVSNVSVSASGLTLYTFPKILAGETREFTRDVSIQITGQYQFVASCKDQLNQTVSFNSNIVYISYASPTAAPTEVPILAPAQPTYLAIPNTIRNEYSSQQALLGNIGNAALIIAAIGGVLLIVGIVLRLVIATARKGAIEHLDSSSVRDYETDNGDHEETEETVVRRDDTDPDPEDFRKASDASDENVNANTDESTDDAEEGKPEA